MSTTEKEVSHTPGPWHPISYAGFWEIQTEPYYGPTSVLNEDHFPNAEANAKLCAAAPDLLEGARNLKHFVETWVNHTTTHEQMQLLMAFEAKVDQMLGDAIKKATE